MSKTKKARKRIPTGVATAAVPRVNASIKINLNPPKPKPKYMPGYWVQVSLGEGTDIISTVRHVKVETFEVSYAVDGLTGYYPEDRLTRCKA